MGNKLVVALETRHPVYGSGEVRGTVYLEAGEDLEFNELNLEFHCEETFEYSGRSPFELSTHESHRLMHSELALMKELRTYVGGQHAFPFKLNLPPCPGSLGFERASTSMHITYSLRAKLYKPHQTLVLESEAAIFHVNEATSIAASKPESLHYELDHKIVTRSCCSERSAGTVRLGLRTDKNAYLPGEAIVILVSVKNSSSQPLGRISVNFAELACVFSSGSEFAQPHVLDERILAENLEPEQLIASERLELLVPAGGPPDGDLARQAYGRHCVLTHCVRVQVRIPDEADSVAEIVAPVTIELPPKTLKAEKIEKMDKWKPHTKHDLVEVSVPLARKPFGLQRKPHFFFNGLQISR